LTSKNKSLAYSKKIHLLFLYNKNKKIDKKQRNLL